MIRKTTPQPSSPLDKARDRLEKAALVVGKHFDEETDPRWPAVHEYEAAALEFYRAYRAMEREPISDVERGLRELAEAAPTTTEREQ